MPRVEFNRLSEAIRWLELMQGKKRTFIGFFTEAHELIIQPTTSTAPVTYGYVPNVKESEVIKHIQEECVVDVIRCKRFEWNHDNTLKKE